MNMLITFLGSHLLTLVEHELLKAEPAIESMIAEEIKLLMSKLENLIASKQQKLALVSNIENAS